MQKAILPLLSLTLLLFFATTAKAAEQCFVKASQRYNVPVKLLKAIAKVESGGNPHAIGTNNNGMPQDIGLMQINESWLPKLANYGIHRSHLFDPCVSIHVGAWILAHNIKEHGYTWRAIGAYNAKTEWKRERYVRKVYTALGAIN